LYFIKVSKGEGTMAKTRRHQKRQQKRQPMKAIESPRLKTVKAVITDEETKKKLEACLKEAKGKLAGCYKSIKEDRYR
jgi:hypothetical protein